MQESRIITAGNFPIGGDKTFIIAEIGSNHNQSLDLAYETIDAAVAAGADAVKFQSLKLDELYHHPSERIVKLHAKIDLEESWHYDLKNYCDEKGIMFFSAPTYLKSIDILEEIQVPLYKLASAQIGTFPQLIKRVAAINKPTILSTGIINEQELDDVINIFKEEGNDQFIILHCNSIYPTPANKVNLNRMLAYHAKYKNPVGFSDHTDGIAVPIAAVALGAKVIEKHFTLSKDLPVPDAAISIDPKGFAEMVQGIRQAELALGSSDRAALEDEEASFREEILYRLVLNTPKKANEIFKMTDFDFKRNGQGINCKELDRVLGKKAASNLDADTLLLEDHISKEDR